MRKVVQISILMCFINTVVIGQQNRSKTFEWTDNSFEIGERREIQLYFEVDGSCKIRSGARMDVSKSTIDTVLAFLKENPETRIEIGYHSDQRTPERYSRDVTAMKAKCVREELINQGADAGQIIYRGYGATMPVISKSKIQSMKTQGEKELAHSKNRRIEVVIIRD